MCSVVAAAALHAGSAAAVEACSAVLVAVMATADVVVMVWWTATVALLRGGESVFSLSPGGALHNGTLGRRRTTGLNYGFCVIFAITLA